MKADSKLRDTQFLLAMALRIIGMTLLLATATIFLPVDWMEQTHQFLQVGPEFPREPITVYLARSTSALYAIHGAIVFYISFDVLRYCSIAKLIGWLNVALGLTILGVDVLAPMPLYWTLLEGIPVVGGGVLLIILAQAVSKQAR